MILKLRDWLIRRFIARLSPAPPHDPNKPGVVLLHGIHDPEGKMNWLARRFGLEGYETFCPLLTPNNGSVTLEESAEALDRMVAAHFGESRALHIVGFSMGGLVTRYWLAHYPVRERVLSFATISSPHQGTLFAYTRTTPGVREMRPGSPFLRELAEHDNAFLPLKPLSVYTPLDLIILPPGSSIWPAATTKRFWSAAHPLMVFSPAVADTLLQHVYNAERTRGTK